MDLLHLQTIELTNSAQLLKTIDDGALVSRKSDTIQGQLTAANNGIQTYLLQMEHKLYDLDMECALSVIRNGIINDTIMSNQPIILPTTDILQQIGGLDNNEIIVYIPALQGVDSGSRYYEPLHFNSYWLGTRIEGPTVALHINKNVFSTIIIMTPHPLSTYNIVSPYTNIDVLLAPAYITVYSFQTYNGKVVYDALYEPIDESATQAFIRNSASYDQNDTEPPPLPPNPNADDVITRLQKYYQILYTEGKPTVKETLTKLYTENYLQKNIQLQTELINGGHINMNISFIHKSPYYNQTNLIQLYVNPVLVLREPNDSWIQHFPELIEGNIYLFAGTFASINEQPDTIPIWVALAYIDLNIIIQDNLLYYNNVWPFYIHPGGIYNDIDDVKSISYGVPSLNNVYMLLQNQ